LVAADGDATASLEDRTPHVKQAAFDPPGFVI
jgi:hypothetical protein